MGRLTVGIMTVLLGLLPVMAARSDSGVFPSYRADYSLARNSLTIGTASFSLRPDGEGDYVYKSVSHASGLAALFVGDVITQMSRFDIAGGQPRPLSYTYAQSGGKHDKSETIQFDWDKGFAQGDEDGRQRQ